MRGKREGNIKEQLDIKIEQSSFFGSSKGRHVLCKQKNAFYKLDTIISVGCRENSSNMTFWKATARLKKSKADKKSVRLAHCSFF